MPTLRYDDFENIKRRYPQRGSEGTINYAFAGGGAAMLLLDADHVEDRNFKDISVGDGRNHKDLDIAAFNSVFGIRKNKNRHDVYGINFGGPLLDLDYGESEIPCHGIYVEVLRGTYFGFKVPTTDDTVIAIKDNKKYITLSPEFVAASKTMGAQGFREGIDDVDAHALLARFNIDKKYFAQLALQSEFRPILEDQNGDNLESNIFSGEYYQLVKKKIIERYKPEIPFVEQIPYDGLVTLLKFEPGDIVTNDEQRRFISESVASDPLYRLCMTQLLKYNSIYEKKSLEKAVEMVDGQLIVRNRAATHRVIAFTTELNKLISTVEQVYKNKKFQSDIATQILNGLFDTNFLHVKISQYQKELEKIKKRREERK